MVSHYRDTNRVNRGGMLEHLDTENLKIGGRRPVLKITDVGGGRTWDPADPTTERFTRAAQRHFEFPVAVSDGTYRIGSVTAGPSELDSRLRRKRISAFRDASSGMIRMAYREVVLSVAPGASARDLSTLLSRLGLERRAPKRFDGLSITAYDPDARCDGLTLLDRCEEILTRSWVTHASPNFVSQYVRTAQGPAIPPSDRVWHLLKVNAAGAWKIQAGDPSITIAIIDDGIDVGHPALLRSVATRPDPHEPMDLFGRNFCVADDHPDHFDPRPSRFGGNPEDPISNDIHGTACAGVAAAPGPLAWGMAPGCRILPVKVFPTSEPVADQQVARAIRYAALHSDVISCSWSGPASDEVALALQDAARFGRQGRGCVIVCASGNAPAGQRAGGSVSFPGNQADCIAVGASTPEDTVAEFSNRGPELSVVAPADRADAYVVFTTDVSAAGRGFEPGRGVDGQYTAKFGGTSSAAAMVAGLAALLLCKQPTLRPQDVRDIIQAHAVYVGSDGGAGRIDAEAAIRAVR